MGWYYTVLFDQPQSVKMYAGLILYTGLTDRIFKQTKLFTPTTSFIKVV